MYLNTDSEEAVELIMWLMMLREEIYGNLFEPISSIYSALVATIQLGWFPPRGMSIVPCSCIDWCSSPKSRETHAKECVVSSSQPTS